ncbi:MAG: CYTH domain-containing protein [candidate division Zixibacteria bacterium]|nr:CYTH domain-containing protein [candidate division Zixibacteria bacterium]
MSDSSKSLEIEIKLQLESFPDYLKLIGFLGNIDYEDRHLNAFFDSEDRHLSSSGWVFRVRVENERGLITVKDTGRQAGSAMVRQEIEAEISRAMAMDILNLRLEPLSISVTPVEFIRREFPELKLAKLIQFNNVRQRKTCQLGDKDYVFEIDKTEFSDGSVDYEVEIELTDIHQIENVENDLRKLFGNLNIPYARQTESKLARALKKAKLL